MKTVIEMAREAGLIAQEGYQGTGWFWVENNLEHFAELVRADERNSWPAEMEAMERQVNILTDALAEEREACARVCDVFQARDVGMQPAECAGAIRARGSNT
jgi:hypothetical protein